MYALSTLRWWSSKRRREQMSVRGRARKPRKKSMLIMLGKICVKIRPNWNSFECQNKYLKHHGLHQHIKSHKNDKVKVIARHWLLQMNPEGPDPLMLQTRLGERDGADKDPYKTVTAMKMSTAEVKVMIMIRTTMIPSTLGVKMSSLPLSMTRKKLRDQQRHALEDP